MNIVAVTKRGKSFLTYTLAMAVADGALWFDAYQCVAGPVLMIDGELHKDEISHRLHAVAKAQNRNEDYQDKIDVLPLRGKGKDLNDLESIIRAIEPNRFALVIFDALYRFLPAGVSENDNGAMMRLYNKIDEYASHLESAAWVNIHHPSKGDQGDKATTDVGFGAGSQSRADTHLILREHNDPAVAVIDAVVRSWKQPDPICIRWNYPLWQFDPDADPKDIKKNGRGQAGNIDEDRQRIVNYMVANPRPMTRNQIRNGTFGKGSRFDAAWDSLINDHTSFNLERSRGEITCYTPPSFLPPE